MLKLADLRKTTRRSGEGPRVVYPRLLRDRTLAPRIEMAVRYLERMLGHPRRELDQEVLVQLFGDHKLARCIVACLATSYRHRERTFAEVLRADEVQQLTALSLQTPSEVRLWLFRRVNAEGSGFIGGAERAPFLRAAGEALGGLAPEQIELLTTLDLPANAVLMRQGPLPTADDVIARFNYATVAALLANAPIVRVALHRTPAEPAAIRDLCAALGVAAELDGRHLVLHGHQDAQAGWARHGARLVRLLSALLVCGLPARSAEALVASPSGEEWRFRIDAETLGYLGQPTATANAHYASATLAQCWREADRFVADVGALRRTQGMDGWSLRRGSEPLVLAGAVVPTLFVCVRGEQRVPLVPLPASAEGLAALIALATRQPVIALRSAAERDGATSKAEPLPTLAYDDRDDLARLPMLLAQALGEAEQRQASAQLSALLDEVRSTGVLTEPRIAERLGCEEEQIAARLLDPAARSARQARALHYIEGFGLCSAAVLAQAQAAASDVARLRAGQPVGQAWVVRQLGRRLRQVTGASEGIECLIAYLGAA